jgi:hypothetical protein
MVLTQEEKDERHRIAQKKYQLSKKGKAARKRTHLKCYIKSDRPVGRPKGSLNKNGKTEKKHYKKTGNSVGRPKKTKEQKTLKILNNLLKNNDLDEIKTLLETIEEKENVKDTTVINDDFNDDFPDDFINSKL